MCCWPWTCIMAKLLPKLFDRYLGLWVNLHHHSYFGWMHVALLLVKLYALGQVESIPEIHNYYLQNNSIAQVILIISHFPYPLWAQSGEFKFDYNLIWRKINCCPFRTVWRTCSFLREDTPSRNCSTSRPTSTAAPSWVWRNTRI